MVVTSFAELSVRMDAICTEVDLVSFDIFDTLLERHVEPPDSVKIVSARKAGKIFAAAVGVKLSDIVLLMAREEAETALRLTAKRQGLDFECAFTDIAKAMAHVLAPGKEDTLKTALIEAEVEAEIEALFLRVGVLELLSAIRVRGKNIVAVSDMYLDKALINRLFQHFGLDRLIDRIYVSADLKLGKYSGRLFHHVLKVEGITPTRMIHIGDNHHSDYAIPRSLGIRACHLFDCQSLQRRQTARTLQWLGARNPFWRGEYLLGLIPTPTDKDFHYRYGYSQLGSIFCTFALGILEEVSQSRIEKVFFLARDGDIFRALYSKLALNLAEHAPIAGYLYLSRKSLFLPSAWRGLTRRHLDVVLYNPKQKGLFSVANALGIPSEEFAGIASRFGLESIDQPIWGWRTEQYERLLADNEFHETIVRYALPARLLLRSYLDGEGFFGRQHIALADIGWNGTIQYALRETFGEDDDFPKITGYYLSFNDGFRYAFEPNEVRGILYDGRTSPRQQNVFALFEELFENAARAVHGTTIGYRVANGRTEPVLRDDVTADRQSEREFEVQISILRLGVLDFADAFSKAIRLTGYSFEDVKSSILARAERCVVYPSREETDHLLRIVHSEDLGSENLMNFSEYRLPGLKILLRPKRFLRLMRASNWKYGSASTLGLPGFNHFLRRLELCIAWYKDTPPHTDLSPCPRPRPTERVLLVLVKRGHFTALNQVRKLLRKFKHK